MRLLRLAVPRRPCRRARCVPAAPAAAQETLKMNISVAQNSHYGVAIDTFAREVEKRTDGRYKVQNFYAGALGAERESIEGVQLGTLDLTLTSTGPIPNFVPEVAILDIPFLFRDYAQARAVLDGPIGQEMLQKFPPKGIVALAWAENGFRHMTNSKRAGQRPRRSQRPQDADDGESDSHTGVQAIRHPANADGVHRGVHGVAAGHGGRPGESAFGDHGGEARSGAEESDAHRSCLFAGLILMNKGKWDKLSAADKQAFQDAAKEAVKANRARIDDDEAKAVADLRAKGMVIVENVDKGKFQAVLAPVYADFGKRFGQENIDRIKNYK